MEFLVWLIFAALTIIPLLRLLPHFGINKYWAAVCVIPFGVLVLLWVMAMRLQDMERR